MGGGGFEINPFLHFASRVKLDWSVDTYKFGIYTNLILSKAEPLLSSLSLTSSLFASEFDDSAETEGSLEEVQPPQMPRLDKWMSPRVWKKMLILKKIITESVPKRFRSHFLLAFASILRPVSNMKLTPHAFGSNKLKEDAPVFELFAEKLFKMKSDLEFFNSNFEAIGTGMIFNGDCRNAEKISQDIPPIKLAVTSPPYLNNLDYTIADQNEIIFLGFCFFDGRFEKFEKSNGYLRRESDV